MENQRVRITKMLLKDALTKLLYEKKIEKISVTELCEKAGINRSTFYKHYGSQFDVYDEMEQDFFDMASEMLTYDVIDGKSGICRFLEFLRNEKEKVYAIIVKHPGADFIEKIFNMPVLIYFTKESYNPDFSETQNKYMRLYEYNGGFAIIRKWVATGCKEEPGEIEEILLHLADYRWKKARG